jgi:hypothetical protein
MLASKRLGLEASSGALSGVLAPEHAEDCRKALAVSVGHV